MADGQTSLADLGRIALETYREEYRELSDNWRNLDTKAQGLGAIAGIFLAAVFAWGRNLPADFGPVQRWMLVAAIVLLVVTIAFAVLALHVRMVAAPPLGDETANMVTDILQKHKVEEMPARLVAFYNDQIEPWKDTNEDTRRHCLSKAFRIQVGQVAVLLAAVIVAALAVEPVLGTALNTICGGQ
jgi:hypothetical protein